jgi:SIR2-like protein
MLFLGAGASVRAGISEMGMLYRDYKSWLQSNSKTEEFKIVDEIETILKSWIKEKEIDIQIDIELLLETIERLENVDKDFVTAFYKNMEFVLPEEFKKTRSLSKGLKEYIRIKCFVPEENTDYLDPMLNLLSPQTTLNIFSTNYDNTVEQFCDRWDIRYVDGFDSTGWNPKIFKESSAGIRLYKIHGSITWWRTDEGDYKSLPLKDPTGMITLSSGRSAVPFIVYPGRKLEYSEPVFDILFEFREQLKTAKYIIIVGYSLRDYHIRVLFQYAAQKNRNIITILISPSAYNVYDKRLRFYFDEEFPKPFTSGFTSGFNSPRSSKLEGRVIYLPYKLENVLPILKHRYLDNLAEAEKLHNEWLKHPESDWQKLLMLYIDSEYLDKVEEIIEKRIGWDKIESADWRFSTEVVLKCRLNTLVSGRNDQHNWRDRFERVTNRFSVNNVSFIPTLGWTASFPPHIKLEINNPGGRIHSEDVVHYIQGTIAPILEDKLRLVSNPQQELIEFLDRVRELNQYLVLWDGESMTFQRYRNLREGAYPAEIEQFRNRVQDFQTTMGNEEGQRRIIEVVEQIERREIQRIYGGNTFPSL